MKPLLVVMTKAPKMGAAKSRLAKDVGVVTAWRIKRRLDNLCFRQTSDMRWQTILATPKTVDLSAHYPNAWPKMGGKVGRICQVRGDLGARMAAIFKKYGRARAVIVIGTDAPKLDNAYIAQALKALKKHHIIMGPANDGGYVLIGARSGLGPKLRLDNIRWSSPHAMDDTIKCMAKDWRIGQLRTLIDVDEAADLGQLRPHRL